jgi:periplasmic divalent cation tolerance protein
MSAAIIIFVTAGTRAEADRIARVLVEERLAACVSRIGGVRSLYRWQGGIEESEEELLVIKTRADRFEAAKKRIEQIHSYSVPEIIAFPISQASRPYLEWLVAQVDEGGG